MNPIFLAAGVATAVIGLGAGTAGAAPAPEPPAPANQRLEAVLSEVLPEVGKHAMARDPVALQIEKQLESAGASPTKANEDMITVEDGGAAGYALAVQIAQTIAGA